MAFYVPTITSDQFGVVMARATTASPVDNDFDSSDGAIYVQQGAKGYQHTDRIMALGSCIHSSDIYVVTQQESGRLALHIYDPGTTAWTVRDEHILWVGEDGSLYDTLLTAKAAYGVSIAVRADGDVLVGFAGESSAAAKSSYAIVRTAGSWGSIITLDSTIVETAPILVGPGGSDETYCYWKGSTTQILGQSILSSDSLASSGNTPDSVVDTADNVLLPGGRFTDGEYWGAYIDSSNQATVFHDNFSDPLTSTTNETNVSDDSVKGHGTTGNFTTGCLYANGTKVGLVYISDADGDIMHEPDVESPGTDTAEAAATALRVSCAKLSSDLGIVYDDNGTTKWLKVSLSVTATAAGAQTLPAITQSGVGLMHPDASGTQTLPGISQSGAAVETFSVAGAQTLPSISQVGVGLMHPDAAGAQTLPSIAQAGAADEIMSASSAQTLPAITQAGAAEETILVSSAQTLPSVTQAGVGLMHPDATGAQTLPSITQVGDAELPVEVAGAQTLPGITQAGVGLMHPDAAGAQTLPSITQAGAITHTEATAEAAGAQTLPSITQAGAATETIPVAGAQALPSITQAGVAKESLIVVGAQTLAAITQAGVGLMHPDTSGAQALPSITQQGAAVLGIASAGAQTLPAITQSGVGDTDVVVSGAQILPSITQVGASTTDSPVTSRNLNQGLLANPSTLVERRIANPN